MQYKVIWIVEPNSERRGQTLHHRVACRTAGGDAPEPSRAKGGSWLHTKLNSTFCTSFRLFELVLKLPRREICLYNGNGCKWQNTFPDRAPHSAHHPAGQNIVAVFCGRFPKQRSCIWLPCAATCNNPVGQSAQGQSYRQLHWSSWAILCIQRSRGLVSNWGTATPPQDPFAATATNTSILLLFSVDIDS